MFVHYRESYGLRPVKLLVLMGFWALTGFLVVSDLISDVVYSSHAVWVLGGWAVLLGTIAIAIWYWREIKVGYPPTIVFDLAFWRSIILISAVLIVCTFFGASA